MRHLFLLSAALLMLCFVTADHHLKPLASDHNWAVYGGDNAATRYVPLDQVNIKNAGQLKQLWEYHTGENLTGLRSQIQCNPLVINGVLYGLTAQNKLFALDASTGKELWKFDPFTVLGGENPMGGTGRGVSYWSDGQSARILFCAGSFMMAVDAKTGKSIADFGSKGFVDLHKDLDYHTDQFLLTCNTPGIVYKDLIILGMRLSEGLDAAPGHIRAYDVRTGQRRWIFHTIPHPGEYGYKTWKNKNAWQESGGANCWAGLSLDEQRGVVYFGTGSATYDFWGGYRPGDNLFSNCIMALDANTGKRKWHYQTIHHDVWDRDLPANPNLVTIERKGKKIDAVAQITKHGYVFVLNRDTGKPLFPVDEIPVPQSDLKGEKTAKTQPMPTLPAPFMRQRYTQDDIINISPEHHAEIANRIAGLRLGNMWDPPSLQGQVLFPGFDGGGEWGGAAYDPQTGVLYVNANEMPWTLKMQVNDSRLSPGQKLYNMQCANCHGTERQGNGANFPKLTSLGRKYTPAQVMDILEKGRGAMPAYRHVPLADRQAIVDFLMDIQPDADADQKEITGKAALESPFVMTGYERLTTKDGYPGIKPPWGTLNAIDLNTGKLLWKVPLGEYAELTAKGIPVTGTENYGGPVVTAGGLVFIGASKDGKFRAFDKQTGDIVFETTLPAGGYATPAVYSVGGKQFVVIACGGGKMGTKSGDSYVAFGLE